MNNSLDRLFDGVVHALLNEVIPRLDDEFARGQAYAAADLLNNLRPRIDWAAAPLVEQIAAQEQLRLRLAPLLANRDAPLPPAAPAALPKGGSELKALRDRSDAVYSELIHWLAAHRAALPAIAAQAADTALREYMEAQIRREVGLAAKPLFGEIAGGKT